MTQIHYFYLLGRSGGERIYEHLSIEKNNGRKYPFRKITTNLNQEHKRQPFSDCLFVCTAGEPAEPPFRDT